MTAIVKAAIDVAGLTKRPRSDLFFDIELWKHNLKSLLSYMLSKENPIDAF